MMANCKEDRQWSGMEMEVGEGLKTLECLRGRLLAERQASRSAKEEAEVMGKKLIELENQIRKEIALRNKAEKRLKLLMKKLESLNVTSISMASETSTPSEISTNPPATKETEEQELKLENLVSTMPENLGEQVPEMTISKQGNGNFSVEDNNHQTALNRANSSPKVESPKSSRTDPHQTAQISRRNDQSFSVEANEREHGHCKENLLASVPATLPVANSATREMKLKPAHERVTDDVLDALKHIKENSRSSFQRRHNMKAIMSM